MKVKNKSCIRHLSFKQLKAAKMRNVIAIFAIALTTLLFTSLFTISMSINSSFEEYQFRQMGGYCHGTFKDVDEKKAEEFSNHKKVKAYGLRTVCGIIMEPPFAKIPAEISWMDDNCAKWSYVSLKEGHLPKEKNEIVMDTLALEKLGIPAEIGAEVQLTYMMNSQEGGSKKERTDSFTLVGFWEYDKLSPVHYINVSREYVKEVEADYVALGGVPFRSDMNVMLASSINIRGVMESIDTDLGYQWENREADDCVRIGVNWGYSASELGSSMDPMIILAIVVFLLLVIFTGYLIIYNIFRISVSSDVRFYGLLKTIGTTPRQLKRMIRHQALCLCVVGIPIGFLGGYGVGSVLTPVVIAAATTMGEVVKISASPVIFLFSGIFAVITVLLSCMRPGRMAAKISPVEAVRYTESKAGKKKSRATRGASLPKMAFANLGRSRTKTVLVLLSLSLAVILLNSVYALTKGFDMEKYVSHNMVSDFIVGKTDYFRFQSRTAEAGLSEDVIDEIENNTEYSLAGSGYATEAGAACYVTEEIWRDRQFGLTEDVAAGYLANCEKRGSLVESGLLLEGLDEALFEKLKVVEGDIAPLFDKDSHNIAIAVRVDDYGNVYGSYPEVGTKFLVNYGSEGHFYDSRTGELCEEGTPEEYLEWRITEEGTDIEYNICALVVVPYCMGYRFSINGVEAVLPKEAMERDGYSGLFPMYYLFDTPDEASEAEAEAFLADYTKGESSGLMYESKETVREDFESFRNMFLLLGGVLSFVVGMVGVLNFFNAILTGILSRRREFAMLQSVGMTGKQLKQMLVWEGVFYALGAIVLSTILSVAMEPLAGHLMEGMWWFFSFRFTLLPMVFIIPVFVFLGIILPLAVYHFAAKKSIVERLRENE